MIRKTARTFVLALLALTGFGVSFASYAIFIGSDLTADGSTLLVGYGDEVSSHWLQLFPRAKHNADATITVGVTAEARYPGERTEIPQVEETYRYLSTEYSDFAGFPPPLTNGGLNEHAVAARDIWSPSRTELREMTPDPQHGPQYSDLARIAMERATTAKEAVEIVGSLIDEHNFSTYGGNTHMFADPNEGWIIKEMAGGQGLWVAERLAPDTIRVSRPGYMFEIPEDYQDNPDFMGSDNLVSFAVEQGWYDPEAGEPFNVNEVYGNTNGRPEAATLIEGRLAELAPNITLNDAMEMIRTAELTRDTAGYGQVAHLRSDVRPELATLWVAPTGPVTAPFVPWRIGVDSIPAEYGKHRYLTKGEASRFLDSDWQVQEATEYAFRTFKRLMYFTCDRPDEFLPEVHTALRAFESNALAETDYVEEVANALLEAGQTEAATKFLTDYSHHQADQALTLGNSLLTSIETRTKVQYGVREPTGEKQGGIVCSPDAYSL